MEKRYKEIDGVRYQVIQNTILGSNVVPVGESLPEVTVSDSGKLLGVDSSGEWVPVDAPSDLPDITGNAGKVLTVNSGATGTEWADAPTELPEVTSADAGDVLTVNASGEWEAAAPSGGGGAEPIIIASLSGATIPLTYNDFIGGKTPYLFVGSTGDSFSIYSPAAGGFADSTYGVTFYCGLASTPTITFINGSADGNLRYYTPG